MAPALPVVPLRLVGEAVDLRAPGVADDLGLHHRAVELVGRGEHGVAVDDEDGRELDLAAVVETEALDVELLAGFDLVLLAAGGDHCVHGARILRAAAEPVD